MTWTFVIDDRLGIPLPQLELEWDQYSEADRSEILLRWEEIRGTIPDVLIVIRLAAIPSSLLMRSTASMTFL